MIFNAVITALEMSININNFRGHCMTMPATCQTPIKGVQPHIKQISPLAEWVPSAARTFRLVVVGSVNCCEDKSFFLSFVQILLNFSLKSTSCWQMIMAGQQPNDNIRIGTLKTLSDTRWSVDAVASKPLCQNYFGIKHSTLRIADDKQQNLSRGGQDTTQCLPNMWNAIVQRFWINSGIGMDLLRSLREYAAGLHDQLESFKAVA